MNAAQVRKTIKKYMVPFFGEHGYKLVSPNNLGYVFENIDNADLKILYEFQCIYNGPYEITVLKTRSDPGVRPYLTLTSFIEDPSFPDTTYLRGNWYFDTEEELVGALEEQANLFLVKAFKWLKRMEDVDIQKLIFERVEERGRMSELATPEEREKRIQKLRENLAEWRARRLKLKLWGKEAK